MMADKLEKKVGILGVGWLGLALAERLVARGVTVHAAATTETKRQSVSDSLGAAVFVVDLPRVTPSDFFSELTDLVVTIPPGGRKFGAEATDHYLRGLRALLPILSNRPTLRVIYCSSTGVYGSAEGPVTEATPVAPDTHSGRAVVAAERLFTDAGCPLVILRLAGLVGPGRHPGRFFGGKNFPISQSDAPVNLVHQADVVSAIELILATPTITGVYNVCAAAHPSKAVFYGAAAGAVKLAINGSKPGGNNGKVVSSEKLRKLGWAPQIDDLDLSRM